MKCWLCLAYHRVALIKFPFFLTTCMLLKPNYSNVTTPLQGSTASISLFSTHQGLMMMKLLILNMLHLRVLKRDISSAGMKPQKATLITTLPPLNYCHMTSLRATSPCLYNNVQPEILTGERITYG